MKRHDPKKVIKACRVSFEGNSDIETAKIVKVAPITVSNWRKLDIWKQTEKALIEATIQTETETLLKRKKKNKS
ncbi:MAG: hypothetical protein OXH65_06300 [Paracoccaceae bacterium]|nr:hypothetical protein [Paracoccaceae bacterium]